jgi:hypothetical protein
VIKKTNKRWHFHTVPGPYYMLINDDTLISLALGFHGRPPGLKTRPGKYILVE